MSVDIKNNGEHMREGFVFRSKQTNSSEFVCRDRDKSTVLHVLSIGLSLSLSETNNKRAVVHVVLSRSKFSTVLHMLSSEFSKATSAGLRQGF